MRKIMIRFAAVSGDEALIATAAENTPVKLWNMNSGTLLHTIDINQAGGITFSPDCNRLVIPEMTSGRLLLWDIGQQRQVGKFKAHSTICLSAASLPDGRLVSGGAGDELVRIWDVSTNRLLLNLRGESEQALVQVSRRGNVVCARLRDGRVAVWQAPSWTDIEREEKGAL
jgi:WD40 repeat protein